MKVIPIEEEDLNEYSGILNARPYIIKNVNRWWRDAVQKYGLDNQHEWTINFTEMQFEGREKSNLT